MSITLSEWMKALRDAEFQASHPEGFTSAEMAAQLDLHVKTVHHFIAKGIANGTMALAGRRSVLNIAGVTALVPVYRLVETPAPKRRSGPALYGPPPANLLAEARKERRT